MKTSDYIYIAVSTALITICSWITIPTVVPFTLQLFGIFLTLGLLGGKRGTLAILLYILLGIIGIPVFAGFGSGLGIIVGPLGGFILGFIVLSLTVWLFEKIIPANCNIPSIISMIIGLLLCYICGLVHFVISTRSGSNSISWTAAIVTCILPFIIPDLIKLFLATMLCKRLRRHVGVQ